MYGLDFNSILFSLFMSYIELLYVCGLFSWQCLANIYMILPGIRDREIRIPKDLSRATLGQSANRDISVPSVAIRVLAFKHFGV